MAKRVLLIDESTLFRNYLKEKLESHGVEVLVGVNGLDGWVKMRNELPDLVVMDYYLSRKGCIEILKEKKTNRNIEHIPVIMLAPKIDRGHVLELAGMNVKKIFSKPVKMEGLLETISLLIGQSIEMDKSPCVVEAHFNEDILFIEIARGLNAEKVELLGYKIVELLELYDVVVPKVLLMMSSVELPEDHIFKLKRLLDVIFQYAQPNPRLIKILTANDRIKSYVQGSTDYQDISVFSSLEDAMDELVGLKADSIAHDEVAQKKLLTSSKPKKEMDESIQLRYDAGERIKDDEEREPRGVFASEATVAIVDDDFIIQELVKTVFSETNWNLKVYGDGKDFLLDEPNQNFDLVFLDLMMPKVNGFQVLEYLKTKKLDIPVIVFSALSKKETIVKAVGFGIKSYLIKPLKPEQLLKKATEVLSTSF
ncbi:response regulator [Sediminispirochaeta smaragdinae]|jgi:DNA-binding response OmpR family regulator|uniref:Response regulator receiver protein n=1 Tax=Sediminispirochaeta smaragdinae (strain DSM 11293 / JCM 15392 / SEBR 4228) TaxID=573413 RepID=E1R9P4_SEDSS|nr:response regulator [Sediminispirochaeta smaragdinae]ADK83213.1 response regulator receiver protein [Sediminispirochaeta smaragdinae DSM 11293]